MNIEILSLEELKERGKQRKASCEKYKIEFGKIWTIEGYNGSGWETSYNPYSLEGSSNICYSSNTYYISFTSNPYGTS